MTSVKHIKVALLGVFTLLLLVWLALGVVNTSFKANGITQVDASTVLPNSNPNDFVGDESCRACHEDQFKSVADTKHGKLSQIKEWKDKPQSCESCHGAGKAHTEEPSKTNIISFANKTSKEISETCLACHSGKEAHNNFRRGDHYRNDVGCTDCHTAHGTKLDVKRKDSITLLNDETPDNAGPAINAMLIRSETSLCISCHTETKAQFNKPFRHKVLEGAMKCSDCHNAHGGFETRQTKLGIGADASCIKCHSDKQGPFVFEHGPVKMEGCSSCHTPHGTNNPKMLNRSSVRQLCMECHSSFSDADDGAPGTPHNQTQTRYLSCTTCHAKIHGSNSNVYFFR